MTIRDQKIHNGTLFVGRHVLIIPLITAVSQAGVTFFSFTPGHKFQITRVKTYALTATATITGNLLVGGRTAAPLTFASATETNAVLSTTLANVRGSQSEAITIQYTTNGSGALVNGYVEVEYRFRPQAGDVGPI